MKILAKTTIFDDHQSKKEGVHRNANLEMKYDDLRDEFQDKIENGRFTYIFMEKDYFDTTIQRMKKDNALLAQKIDDAERLLESIFDVTLNEERIKKVLSRLTSDLMTIEEKHPIFDELITPTKPEHSQEENDDLVADRIENIKKQEPDQTQAMYLSEEMVSFYSVKDNNLYVRELEENHYIEHKLLELDYYLQKVITVPLETDTEVFLFGGSKDIEGNDVVDDTFEVDLDQRKLRKIAKMNMPKISMATGLSPDCKHILIAGGSAGHNSPTNSCEIFDVKTRKWKKLPSLNCPRMSASLIVATNMNAYCFGGIESDPEDPSKFLPMKSIEWLKYADPEEEWETLKIKTPFKCSSSGAICTGDRSFIIFGGWNKTSMRRSAFIWHEEIHGFNIQELSELEKPDTFVSTGLIKRDPVRKESIIFGVSYCHMYDETKETFSLVREKSLKH